MTLPWDSGQQQPPPTAWTPGDDAAAAEFLRSQAADEAIQRTAHACEDILVGQRQILKRLEAVERRVDEMTKAVVTHWNGEPE